ncbi:MAG: multiheme c-type cytochrome [Myxococcota bacterium]
MQRIESSRIRNYGLLLAAIATLAVASEALAGGNPYKTEGQEKADAANVVGPDKVENNCQSCHALEYDAWLHSRHFATIKDRHRSPRAKEVLANMGQRSMKRAGDCRQCHYTTILSKDKLRAKWGVSCESCHGVAADWNPIHNKSGGKTIAWGTGKSGDATARAARLKPAVAKGMVHSDNIYEIATNCFGCHTVPNEPLVNKGDHKAGSDEFELASWSQGEVRHSFATSAGAPDNPTNRVGTPNQLRRLYVVGKLVDLEYTLRNISVAQENGGKFHSAMVSRANAVRGQLAAILKAVPIPEIAGAVNAVPANISASTTISASLADNLGAAAKKFAQTRDGSKLGALDSMIPSEPQGTPYKG